MRLSDVRIAMSEYATRFQPDLVSAADAADVVEDAAAIKNMAATIEALAAARVAETEVWKRNGDRSAAHQLARTTGTSICEAQETLKAARRLQGLPATADAARRGELSPQQVAVIADAASVNADAESNLLDQARAASYGELRDECARVKANATDLEARRRRIHEHRYLRHWEDTEGAGTLQLRDNPEVVAGIVASLEPIRDELFEQRARKAGASPWRRTPPTPSPSSPAAPRARARVGGGRGEPRSWPGWMSLRSCGATRRATRSASSPATARWPRQRSGTFSTPRTRSWLPS